MATASFDTARRTGSDFSDIEKAPEFRPEPTPTAVPGQRSSLVGLPRAALKERLLAIGVTERESRMRSGQLWNWLNVRGAQDFDQMTNVGKALRAQLAEAYTLDRPEVVSQQVSRDGTRKWLLRMAPTGRHDHNRGAEIECVYIPGPDRGTLCVSSQVGCTLTCSFCHTGTQRLVRNLSAAEITAQLVVARDALGDWPGLIPSRDASGGGEVGRLVTNIVFMGMGEPLYNLENVVDAVATMSDPEGLALSRRRITVSTSGVVPQIRRLGEEAHAMLAISLHAVRDELRDELVPLNRKYPIAELMRACREYPGLTNARRITFEYVMLKGVNDTDGDARELVRLLKGIPAKINLIPFNPWPGSKYECSDWERIERFSEIVFDAGYASPVRTPRGRDILAACGQLKSETEKLRARERMLLDAGGDSEGAVSAQGFYALHDGEE
ncbi:Dual-specificity RNA methyltransferase RlmN [Methylobacterium cerastii]|uniref:Dual-specificity RNA methyltransferase RlmN n=1 Tax=Methylobacterium cerastii TaxID=932741 RepID=A0ABQ4QDF0_9HYPH|nr:MULTISPECIES: 23S rRNA (adenine(2503)-C(2))-methyltransferase RlmN [Methylobacterium]TXN08973.1 23S rRNA (adenine(2503)-C(2))-methyltransferase RlmN [Methylobacterium sp. WL122]TXM75700.1 23S rRNA (adenine(2503)-C(2))-methyltransferase RlmN [Methylobacterium sp. WL12]TXN07042.1 23S rRNA (adenine(2503)-C(2))-methyltransferase RlmN [Methylobacterium sp. WL103]TXN83662.1 23S rRNA (adenine(2503)-C(2))-methyltransferase RlmN [Methylobacterium sp. WL8]GJD42937.1 Dual-specificity RNA methyltransfe